MFGSRFGLDSGEAGLAKGANIPEKDEQRRQLPERAARISHALPRSNGRKARADLGYSLAVWVYGLAPAVPG